MSRDLSRSKRAKKISLWLSAGVVFFILSTGYGQAEDETRMDGAAEPNPSEQGVESVAASEKNPAPEASIASGPVASKEPLDADSEKEYEGRVVMIDHKTGELLVKPPDENGKSVEETLFVVNTESVDVTSSNVPSAEFEDIQMGHFVTVVIDPKKSKGQEVVEIIDYDIPPPEE